jgi:hypothetical protein
MRYLNTILTILALLLALQLWTTWTGTASPPLSLVAQAQAQDGIPNAGAQRKQMIDLLKEQNVKIEKLSQLLESGRVRVRLEAGEERP